MEIVNLYKDIVLVTHLLIFCTSLFTNNNIKVVIQMHSFLFDQQNKSYIRKGISLYPITIVRQYNIVYSTKHLSFLAHYLHKFSVVVQITHFCGLSGIIFHKFGANLALFKQKKYSGTTPSSGVILSEFSDQLQHQSRKKSLKKMLNWYLSDANKVQI